MPYLSRIRINPLRRQSQLLLANPQAMHAAVLAGLPDQPVRERVLWRLDTDNPHRPDLYVLTQSVPSWEHLIEQAGWPAAADQAATRDYQPLLDRVVKGRQFAFRLTANPVQHTPPRSPTGEGGSRRGKRQGHRTAAHQQDWLVRRASAWGIVLPPAQLDATDGPAPADVRIIHRARRSFRRAKDAPPVVLQTVTYEGRLTVEHPDTFRAGLVDGFGPAKAYGCGLMTLAPLPSPAADA